ncbi:MAG: hypothetical protein ABI411_07160 [Tahibacter sp.]
MPSPFTAPRAEAGLAALRAASLRAELRVPSPFTAPRAEAGLAALRAASLRAELRVPSPLTAPRAEAGLARLRGVALSAAAGLARRGAGRFAESAPVAPRADFVLRAAARGLAADFGVDAAEDLRDVGFFVVAKRG